MILTSPPIEDTHISPDRSRRAMYYYWYYIWLMMIAKRAKEEEEEEERRPYRRPHSRYQKRFHRSLSIEDRQLRQRRIPRISLQDSHQSSWRRLYHSENDQALITLTGFDHATFQYLLQLFQPLFDKYTPFGEGDRIAKMSTRGRKRRVTAMDILGLVLAWTRTRGALLSLQLHFGLSMTNLAAYLRFGRRIIVEILNNNSLAWIKIPSLAKVEEYKRLVVERYPALTNVWAAMDGLKTPIQQASTTKQQGYFYNGWKHNHFVTSVFCFCPDGTIPIAYMNLPGSMHDSTIADMGGIYDKLKNLYETTGAITCVDSAFRMRNSPYIIKSSQDNRVGEGDTEEAVRRDIIKKRQATSMRQSSEWGMRALQSSYPRICDRMPYEQKGKRRIAIKMMIYLYNLRARMVGINQIKNVFQPALNRDARNIIN